MFTADGFRDGHRFLFKTDDEGEFIKYLIETDYPSCFSEVTVESKGDNWYRIVLKIPHALQSDEDAMPLMDISSIFGQSNKGWYECRDSGASEDGLTFWYEVRHVGGPHI